MMIEPRRPVYLLPGLGADHRLFNHQVASFPDVRPIDWIPPRRNESIRAYAARIGESIQEDRFVLGGVSFGGVMAQEIAAIRKPEAMILLSTLRSPSEIIAPLRIGKYIPASGFDMMAHASKIFGNVCAPIYGIRGDDIRLIATMLAECRTDFLSWGRQRILHWRPSPQPKVPTLRLHGTRDYIVRPRTHSEIRWIKGAGHLLNLTHSRITNRRIEEFLQKLS